MGAPTPEAALLEALDYYQQRLMKVQAEYKALSKLGADDDLQIEGHEALEKNRLTPEQLAYVQADGMDCPACNNHGAHAVGNIEV